MNPVGRQSSKVYRRRRLVVGAGLLAVLIIVILIIVRPGSGKAAPAGAKPSASTAKSTGVHTPTPSSTIPAHAAAAAGADCVPVNVRVEAITDAVNYDPGQMPQLSLSITNTGKKPCVINAGTAKQVFTITSGKDVYWSSTDCQTDAVDAQLTLKPGTPVSSATPVKWDRVRSTKDTCGAATRTAAPAGGASYHLSVSVDGIRSATPMQFLLY